ncbi:MAG: metal-dependent transcriptional regulator [bacterium]|nr:metal-dependent transcriptional regulator [bacterium]
MEDVWKQFEENGITHSAAHHLLAVLSLKKERGYARVTDVAKHLNITTGSASTNLKSLKQKGFVVEDTNRFLVLSDKGEMLARAVIARKEIFKKFLTDYLHVKEDQAEIDACKTEHLLSHETCERLLAFIQLLAGECSVDWKKIDPALKKSGSLKFVCPAHNGSVKKDCNVCHDHCLLDDC